jgi:putative hydrolase of HD superfamily
MSDRLQKQISFLLELDQLKAVLRRSYLLNQERRENSAEHSWHVAMLANVLAEYADEPVDIDRVTKMLLLHDIVEIDAGDTMVYDVEARKGKAAKEAAAAIRIFGLLPDDQAESLRSVWQEFEDCESPEARFARALDRLMPLLHNIHTQGRTWKENGIRKHQVLEVNAHMEKGSVRLWEYVRKSIEEAAERGDLPT